MKELGRRLSWDRMDPDGMSFDNPFFSWYAAHHSRGQARAVTRKDAPGLDIVMGPYASSRFSVGIDDDATPILGVCSHEAEALGRCRWVDAAFLKAVRGGDWIVLRTSDIRTDEPLYEEPVPVRLWLPAMPGRLDVWQDADSRPDKLRLMTTRIEKGAALLDGKTVCETPLFFRGKWDEIPA